LIAVKGTWKDSGRTVGGSDIRGIKVHPQCVTIIKKAKLVQDEGITK